MEENKRIVILGAGESGVGAALLAKARGMIPFVSDSGKIKETYKKILVNKGIAHEEGGHDEGFLLTADEVIKSPGIPDDIPLLIKFREKKTPIISEIEFASRYTKAKIIAITGTNGKTTTAMLTYHLLKEAGKKVCLAGNVGNSFSKEVIKDKYKYYVLEISSFQLDQIQLFKPFMGVLLNITPDHLDRYEGNMQKYIESKFRLVENMDEKDWFIYFSEDPITTEYLQAHSIRPKKTGISLQYQPELPASMNGEFLKFNLPNISLKEFSINMSRLTLNGPHNMVNTMAAVLVARLLKIPEYRIKKSLKSFKNAAHRLEKIATFGDIQFINDSKATNLDATMKALSSFNQPIIWIAGGIDKGNDYNTILNLVSERVKGIVCLGKDNSKLLLAFKNHIKKIADTQNMKDAVNTAFQMAAKGDIILLSPACASFDLFNNYIDRGDKFKKAVSGMIKKINKEK